jgi:Transposase DDE domain
MTVWRRLTCWGEIGVWERIWRAALVQVDRVGQLDWSMAVLDGSFAPAKNGGLGVGLTRKGTRAKAHAQRHTRKGTRAKAKARSGCSSSTAMARLADFIWPAPIWRRCAWPSRHWPVFASIRQYSRGGRPKQRPAKLVADRGYDSAAFRLALRRRGIAMCIASKRRPASWRAKRGRPVVARTDDSRQRYTVERSFAWLGNYRRLLIRWERDHAIYRSFFTFAVLLVSLRRACSAPAG